MDRSNSSMDCVRHRSSQRILSTISCGLRLKHWIRAEMLSRYGIKLLHPTEVGKDGNGECRLGNVGRYMEGIGYLVDGSRINGIRGGEGERAELLCMLQPSFGEGKEREVLGATVENMRTLLGDWKGEWDKLEDVADVVDGTMKLWVASVPQRYSGEVTGKEGSRLESPPFLLLFSILLSLAAELVSHSI